MAAANSGSVGMGKTFGPCKTCKYYRDNFCRNVDSPYGAKFMMPYSRCFAYTCGD